MIKIVRGEKYLTQLETGKVAIMHRKHIKRSFHNYGREITVTLKNVIGTGSRSGRVYFIRGRSHQASAPGEPPASLSGRLENSFNYKARFTELLVYSNAFSQRGYNYPRRLEEDMNRPYWEVTHKNNAYKLERELQHYGL
jgi:hypothetical protein